MNFNVTELLLITHSAYAMHVKSMITTERCIRYVETSRTPIIRVQWKLRNIFSLSTTKGLPINKTCLNIMYLS